MFTRILPFLLLLAACAPQPSSQAARHAPPPARTLTGTLAERPPPDFGEGAVFKVTGRAVERSGVVWVEKTPNGGLGWYVDRAVVEWSDKVDNCGDYTSGVVLFYGQDLYMEVEGFEIRARFNIVSGEFSGEIRSPCMARSASVQLRSVIF